MNQTPTIKDTDFLYLPEWIMRINDVSLKLPHYLILAKIASLCGYCSQNSVKVRMWYFSQWCKRKERATIDLINNLELWGWVNIERTRYESSYAVTKQFIDISNRIIKERQINLKECSYIYLPAFLLKMPLSLPAMVLFALIVGNCHGLNYVALNVSDLQFWTKADITTIRRAKKELIQSGLINIAKEKRVCVFRLTANAISLLPNWYIEKIFNTGKIAVLKKFSEYFCSTEEKKSKNAAIKEHFCSTERANLQYLYNIINNTIDNNIKKEDKEKGFVELEPIESSAYYDVTSFADDETFVSSLAEILQTTPRQTGCKFRMVAYKRKQHNTRNTNITIAMKETILATAKSLGIEFTPAQREKALNLINSLNLAV